MGTNRLSLKRQYQPSVSRPSHARDTSTKSTKSALQRVFPTAQAYLTNVEGQLAPLTQAYILYCFCSALLPPCPDPVDDPRVPLATITVRKDNCQILKVCDWDRRKIAITLPNLEYWLSIFPYGRQLQNCLSQFCCNPFSLREFLAGTTTNATFANIGNI